MFSTLIYPIIVNWNLATETIPCIESLLAAGASAGQIIVVDNGSEDDSVANLTAHFGQQIHLISHPTNLGFAGGNNLGIEFALAAGAEWVLLLNNDTVVAPTFFQELSEVVKQHPTFQIVGPLIFYFSEPQRIWSLGDRLLPGTLITRQLWRNALAPATLPSLMAVDFLNACCMLIHRSVFERIGLLNPDYFMYVEDVDFCWRARQASIRLGCATQAHVWHKVSRSTGIYHPQARYWRISNQINFYRRAAVNGVQRLIMFLFTSLRLSFLLVMDIYHQRWQLLPVSVRAWYDGWFTALKPAAPVVPTKIGKQSK